MPLGEVITRVIDEETGDEETIYTCSACQAEHGYEYEAHDCCTYFCPWCGTPYTSEDDAEECCSHTCEYCENHWGTAEEAENCCQAERIRQELFSPEYPFEIDNTPVEHSIALPDVEGLRVARYTSVEQELTSGGAKAARLLYRIGISQYDGILGYSQDGQIGQAIVKSDGSLPEGGGEAVYSRFNLSAPQDSERLSRAIACIQELEAQGAVETGERAGVHVHVGATDLNRGNVFGPAQMAALWEIFSFGEDVIYRLGAAGHTEHRGTEYTRILPKLNRRSPGMEQAELISAGKISKTIQSNRYFSVNFRRLLDAAARCSCGACMVGDWAECECGTLERGTIEWRVFNATTDPKILHSWIALAHGVTAAAFTHELGTLQPYEYNTISSNMHPWIFGWLLWNCPFEDSERQLLFDTARISPGLNIPWENIDQFHERWDQVEEQNLDPEPEQVSELESSETVASWRVYFDPNCDCSNCRNYASRTAVQNTSASESASQNTSASDDHPF